MYRFINIPQKFDIDVDFWEYNPQVKYIEPYKTMYEQDDTADKSVSSKHLWCIWLYLDPSYANKIGRLPDEQKKAAILAYNPLFDFKEELINKCIAAYPEHCMTPAARAFRVEEASLIKRAEFIDNAEYTLPSIAKNSKGEVIYVAGKPMQIPGTAKDIDSMRKMTLDLYKKYEVVKKQFEEEEKAEGRIYGGGQRTIMDEGGLQLIKDE